MTASVRHEDETEAGAETEPVEPSVDDVDHYTCCDPAYYLSTEHPIYTICGHKLADGETLKLHLEAPLCRHCWNRIQTLRDDEFPCERLCPRLVFGTT